MNRRDFINKGTAVLIATQIGVPILSACQGTSENAMSNQGINTQGNNGSNTNTGTSSDPEVLKVRFLGTGAADWTSESQNGEHRNWSSILVDGHILIDYTSMARGMLPAGAAPKVIFYTHSHGDHYNPTDALNLGINKVYCGMTWYNTCKADFQKAASATGKPMPVIIGADLFGSYTVDDITFIPLPANHGTGILEEQALIWLMVKDKARVLYATDTGGIMGRGSQFAGFDVHVAIAKRKPLTGLIMEATMGLGYDEDARIFTHSSVETVTRITNVLKKTNLLEGDIPVYTTHMARTLHPSYEQQLKTFPAGIRPAYDGLEISYPAK